MGLGIITMIIMGVLATVGAQSPPCPATAPKLTARRSAKNTATLRLKTGPVPVANQMYQVVLPGQGVTVTDFKVLGRAAAKDPSFVSTSVSGQALNVRFSAPTGKSVTIVVHVALNAVCAASQLEFGLSSFVWLGFDDFTCIQEYPSVKLKVKAPYTNAPACEPTSPPTPAPVNQSIANILCTPIVPTADWVFERAGNGSSHPSCSSPPIVNLARMCQGDPTSIVLDASLYNDGIGCFRAQSRQCKYQLRQVAQFDFDLTMTTCRGVWASFWSTPNHWEGDGLSGEMDWMETCLGTSVQSNWAGCNDGVNCRQVVQGPKPNSFQAHLRIVNDNGYVKVCQCPIDQLAQCDSACGPAFNPATQAFYKNIYKANGCKNQDCIYMIVADIWNGYSGDGGYKGCMYPSSYKNPQPAQCNFIVQNLRLKGLNGANPFIGTPAVCNPLLAP